MSGWNRVVRIERCSKWPSLGRAAVQRSTTDLCKSRCWSHGPTGIPRGHRSHVVSRSISVTGVGVGWRQRSRHVFRCSKIRGDPISTSHSRYGAHSQTFFFALCTVRCYSSRPSERGRHESKLNQTHILVRDILHLHRQAKLAPKKRKLL